MMVMMVVVMTATARTNDSVIHSNVAVFAYFWYKLDRSYLSFNNSLEANFGSWFTMAAML